jgi:type II secretory ATPase GspE/PulE/Tfp pilus assembly ATPase PilB-like protein
VEEPGVFRDAREENVLLLSDPSHGIAPQACESLGDGTPGVVWLRSLLGEAVRRRCREILLEPLEEESRVTFLRRGGERASRAVSRQVQLAVSVTLEDLSKMAALGKTVPREARFKLCQGERHLAVVVTWFPAIHGDAYHLRMVEERVKKEGFEEMMEDYPDARRSLETALRGHRGLLLVAAPDGHYRERIVSSLVQWIRWRVGQAIFLGGPRSLRLPGCELRMLDQVGAPSLPEAIRRAIQDHPDLLAVLRIQTPDEAVALMEAGRERLVVAGIRKQDALDALQWLARIGLLPAVRAGGLCGILGTRMVERICEHCRKRYDLLEEFPNLISQASDAGLYFANTGCRACRGAGVLELEPAFEFLPVKTGLLERVAAAAPREAIHKEWARAGAPSLYASLLARAAAGEVDVREPLRLILLEGRGAA